MNRHYWNLFSFVHVYGCDLKRRVKALLFLFLSQPETLIIDDVLRLGVLVSVQMIKLHGDGPSSDTGRKMEACEVKSTEGSFSSIANYEVAVSVGGQM